MDINLGREELHRLAARDIVVDVEHVKAHRTRKEKKEMSHFEKFVTEGNKKADELYGRSENKDNAARKRRNVRSFLVRSQLSLLGGGMEGL